MQRRQKPKKNYDGVALTHAPRKQTPQRRSNQSHAVGRWLEREKAREMSIGRGGIEFRRSEDRNCSRWSEIWFRQCVRQLREWMRAEQLRHKGRIPSFLCLCSSLLAAASSCGSLRRPCRDRSPVCGDRMLWWVGGLNGKLVMYPTESKFSTLFLEKWDERERGNYRIWAYLPSIQHRNLTPI